MLFARSHVQILVVIVALVATLTEFGADARRSSSATSSSSRNSDPTAYSRKRQGRSSTVTPAPVVDPEDDPTQLPCVKKGYAKHPKDCSRFYRCDKTDTESLKSGAGLAQRFQYDCPPGLVFDDENEVCNWPSYSAACTGSGEILKVQRKKFICPSYGYYQDPHDCAYFYYCSDFGKSSLQAYEFKCPFDLAFDEEKLLCNWKWLVKGCSEAVNADVGGSDHHYLDQHGNKTDDAIQDLDNDRDDLLERRSDDAEDVEFVDSPAEHRTDGGSYTFTKAEGTGSNRKNFARSIKDAVSGALGSVKTMLGMQNEPDKRQDLLDPTMIAEESILSNWFTAVNPFGYANQLAQTVAKTLAPSPGTRPPKKGEQFISIPIISVVPDEHKHEPKPTGRGPRPGPKRPVDHHHGPHHGGPRQQERDQRRPDAHRFQQGQAPPKHAHRGKPVQAERGPHHPRRPQGPTGRPNGHRGPSPSTGRPKKPQQPDLIPVPILTVRETPRPGHPAIERRPDGLLGGGSTKSFAIITVKPTRGRPRPEPEPEPSNLNLKHHTRPRPRPEPEPEPEPQRHKHRKPAGHHGLPPPPHHQQQPPKGHHGGPHHGPTLDIINPHAAASINYPARERPAGLGQKHSKPTPAGRPHKERPHHEGRPPLPSMVGGLPLDLFSNYDIDVKALNVHPMPGDAAGAGQVDLSQIQFLPELAGALADLVGPSKRPFGLPSNQSPGAHKPSKPGRGRERERGTRKPQPSQPTQKRRPTPSAGHHQSQQPVIQLAPQIQLLPQHFNGPAQQHLGPHPQHHQQQQLLLNQYQYQTDNGVQFHHQMQQQQLPKNHHQQHGLAPPLPGQQQSPKPLIQPVGKNGFVPVFGGAGNGPSQFSAFDTVKPNLQAAGSAQLNQYSNNAQSQYQFVSPQATTQWVPSSTTRRPTSAPTLLTKTTKSSLLIIPVPDDHPKASNINDLIRISKDYPHLFPHGFDFSKVESVTRTKADPAPGPKPSVSTGTAGSSSAGSYQGQPQPNLAQSASAKNQTKSDYIMVVVNEELGKQESSKRPVTHQSTFTTTRPPTPTSTHHFTTTQPKTKQPVVIKLEIPEGQPELVKNIVDRVKEGLASPTAQPSHSPVYVSVTAAVSNPASTASSPTPAATSRPTSGTSAASSSPADGDNYFDKTSGQNIPQSLYESIQQVIAQHLYQQHVSPTAAHSSTAGFHNPSTPTETTTGTPLTTPPPTQPPTTVLPITELPHAILEQIPYNYYWHSNASEAPAAAGPQWPYMPQSPWYGNPYAAYYGPQPVYGPQPTNGSIPAQNPYYPYGYPAYQPQGPWPTANYTSYGPSWYEWPYVQPSASQSIPETVLLHNGTATTIDGQRLSSFYITTTVTTVAPPVTSTTTEQPTTYRTSPSFGSRGGRPVVTLRAWTTTPPPTTVPEVATEGFDLLRTKQQANGAAPQIQVYIVQGPNGPQVHTKTLNSADVQKQPNVQVYVVDENNKDKAPAGYQFGQKVTQPPADNYYSYHYQVDESKISKQTTTAPEFYETTTTTTTRTKNDRVQAGTTKVQSSVNPQFPALRNFTDGAVPETACTRPGLFQHPNDCNKFYECYYDRFMNKYSLHLFECPVKLAFDSRIIGCSGPTDPTVCVQY